MKPSYLRSAEVLRIIDGDTLEVSIDLGHSITFRTSLRLAGINTLELHDKDPKKRAKANLARDYVDSMIGGKSIITETIKPKDKYSRYLCNVYLEDGRCLNQLLIDNGLAQPWDGQGEKP